jgi:hypothetical protein
LPLWTRQSFSATAEGWYGGTRCPPQAFFSYSACVDDPGCVAYDSVEDPSKNCRARSSDDSDRGLAPWRVGSDTCSSPG